MTKKDLLHFISLSLVSTFLMLISYNVHSQVPVINKGEWFTITRGSFIYINGSYTNTSRGGNLGYIFGDTLTRVIVTDSVINNNPFIELEGITTYNTMIDGKPEFLLVGDRPQKIGGTTPIHFYKLTINKSADSIRLAQDVRINDTLKIVNGNIHLNHHNIYLHNFPGVNFGALSGERMNHQLTDHRDGRGSIYARLSQPANNVDLAGLGLSFQREAGSSIGKLKISRGHGKIGGPGITDGGPGDGSILRYYHVELTDKDLAQEIPVVKMTYFDNELDGLVSSSLGMWVSQSSDSLGAGSEWQRHSPATPGLNEMSAINLFVDTTRFTLAPFSCSNPPVISFPSDTIFLCEGADTTLNPGVNGMIVSWANDISFATPIASTSTLEVSDAGKYYIRAIDVKGCFTIDSVVVKSVRNPIALMRNLRSVCFQDTARFQSLSTANEPGGMTYLWNFGNAGNAGSHSQDTLYVYPSAGTYIASLQVTNYYGCQNTDTDTITISPVPVADFSVDNVCLGQTALFTNMSVLSSGAGMTYQWALGDGSTSIMINPEHNYTSAATFNVRLIAISNGSQCKDTSDKIIQAYAAPTAGYTFSNDCMLQDIPFTNTSTSPTPGALTYSWSFGDGTASDQINPVKRYTESDLYDVRLIATTAEGCKDTAVTLQQPSGVQGIYIRDCSIDCSNLTPVVNLGPDRHLCDGEVVLFDAGNPTATYQWSDGSTTRTINVSSQGVYNVRVRSAEGCLGFDQVEVTVTPGFSVSLGADVVLCSVQGLIISPVISRTGNFSYTWGSDVGIGGSTQELTVHQAGKYWITVNDLSGCGFFDRDTIEIRPTSNGIKAEFLVASNLKLGDPVEFVQLSNPNPTIYSWSFGDGITSIERQPVHTYLLEGNYKVLFTVSNGVCTDTLSKLISVVDPVIRSGGNLKDTTADPEVNFVELPQPLVYPNPTEGAFTYELNLEKEATVDIQIYSLQGMIISTRRIKGTSIREKYDLTEEGSGLYLIRTILNDQMVVSKIIKL